MVVGVGVGMGGVGGTLPVAGATVVGGGTLPLAGAMGVGMVGVVATALAPALASAAKRSVGLSPPPHSPLFFFPWAGKAAAHQWAVLSRVLG
jgi:hypothetical protein